MVGMTSIFDSDQHSFIGGEIGAYILRLAKKTGRDFAVIRYHELGVFCIIEFISPLRDVFVDTMNLGKSLANFDRKRADELQQRIFAPITADDIVAGSAEADSEYHHLRQDWNAEEQVRLEKCARGE
jgi:hypothetical protein